jgi:hypothetical protein
VLKKEKELVSFKIGIRKYSWTLVAHSCNPSYSGGRDQKDHGLKLILGK